MIKKILVAINGSEGSIKAAMYSIMMARDYNFQIKFVYVIDFVTKVRIILSMFSRLQQERALLPRQNFVMVL